MGVYINNMEMPTSCNKCPFTCEALQFFNGKDRPNSCPLIEIDLEKDIPTIWYNRQTGQYEPKGTKQEVYERLYKLKNRERRADEHNT